MTHPEFLDSALSLAIETLYDQQTKNANGAAASLQALRDVLDSEFDLSAKLAKLVARQLAASVS